MIAGLCCNYPKDGPGFFAGSAATGSVDFDEIKPLCRFTPSCSNYMTLAPDLNG